MAGLLAGLAVPATLGPRTPPRAPDPPSRASRHSVCADVRAPLAHDSEDLRLRWCEARLAEASRETPTLRRDWPTEIPPEDEPGAWSEAVDAAVRACSLQMSVELTDCEEFPCVAALRPSLGVPEEARDALNACLSEHLGKPTWGAAGSIVVRAHCPDGTEEPVLLLMAMTDAGESALGFPPDDFTSIPDFYMLLGRRAESALHLWQCHPPSPGAE